MTRVAVLAGDGIGPEVTAAAVRVLTAVDPSIEFVSGLVGGAAYRAVGEPLPQATLDLASGCAAILFGAVGDPALDHLPPHLRPEQAVLGLRKQFGLFANLRPVTVHPALADASTLKPKIVAGLDILIVRELTGDIYFGKPRGRRTTAQGEREGFDTMRYTEGEIARVARVAFEAARGRRSRVTSVDKANVLATMQLWREVVTEVARDYPDVALDHMYVDNAAMQLVRDPRRFDVILTGNMFGDILSDQASMLTGSIGLLPSASIRDDRFGLYEPIHGSAPDIAGRDIANPIGAILSAATLLRHSLADETGAARIERAVASALASGARTKDIQGSDASFIGTIAMTLTILGTLS